MSDKLLQEMVDYKAIQELKARFVQTVDAKDWDGFRTVSTPKDGPFEFGGEFIVQGGDAFLETVAGQLENAVSVHGAFLPQISFKSPMSCATRPMSPRRAPGRDSRKHARHLWKRKRPYRGSAVHCRNPNERLACIEP
jgi:hypothetical protein